MMGKNSSLAYRETCDMLKCGSGKKRCRAAPELRCDERRRYLRYKDRVVQLAQFGWYRGKSRPIRVVILHLFSIFITINQGIYCPVGGNNYAMDGT